MAERTFCVTQIMNNCSLLFPGKSPTMITVNDHGTRRMFVVSATTGKLLLEFQGTWSRDFSNFLEHTEDLLASHVGTIRSGNAPIIGNQVDDLKSEIEKLKNAVESLQKNYTAEVAGLKKELDGLKDQVSFKKQEAKRWKSEYEDLRRDLAHQSGHFGYPIHARPVHISSYRHNQTTESQYSDDEGPVLPTPSSTSVVGQGSD
ncbi:hypothetical protein BDD12DRAFT_980952 [Trichophaea hybrida]|nr:hypothetical protein BDD12DRAFT_980952 [Trichophaea hybrida]